MGDQSRENGAQRLGLIADIFGVCSGVGLVIPSILKSLRILDVDAAKVPLILGVVAASIAGLILIVQGVIRYFSFSAMFRGRSPWWDLLWGTVLLLIAFGGWKSLGT